ncbi:nucleotide sugar dehydrogenase [Rhizobium sp. 32-5/1]|uniref:nucleotide sugar dehydrogenase n=1 Tax=Rhizobium sp. 32-5/1 TaxID=3019602 RepID=UPI0032B87ABF
MNRGISPITEPGVDELLREGLAAGRISAYTEVGDRLHDCDMAIVCVGTPSAPDGAHNMTFIAEVTRQIAVAIGRERTSPLTMVYRSTIRPGTVEGLIVPILAAELGDSFEDIVELIYNPEFLRESSAVQDFFDPPKIVIGTVDGEPSARMDLLNQNLKAATFYVRVAEAEITKFVDNTWHAVKVTFANEIGRICMQLGLNTKSVHEIFVSDTKLNISPYYMRPGGAFGGSCLPKDVRALQYIATDCGANAHLVDALLRSNEAHKYRLFEYATQNLAPGASILLVGLAFKAHTDDLRESPNIDLARRLLQERYDLSVFDPAIDANKLIGANLGYAYTRIPTLSRLLVTREAAERRSWDCVIITNDTYRMLDLSKNDNIVNLNTLS